MSGKFRPCKKFFQVWWLAFTFKNFLRAKMDFILSLRKSSDLFFCISELQKRLRICPVISGNYHYITVLCPFNLLIRFKCYNTVQNKYKTNINKYILHVLPLKLRDKLYSSCSIPTPGFPHFYYMLGANLGLLLYGEVSVMGYISGLLGLNVVTYGMQLLC